jgi:two-component system, OmpR family, phosphate regulon sensor histidine kinase PhoR
MGTIKRIGLILLLIFLLPALFFSAYEIASLNQDEVVINEIYEKQLEAILFSANHYSDDILSGWIAKIEIGFEVMDEDTSDLTIEKLLQLNSSIQAIVIYDTLSNTGSIRFNDVVDDHQLLKKTLEKLRGQKPMVNQLIKYQKSGFKKVESLSVGEIYTALIFHPSNVEDQILYSIIVDPELFIEEVIGPKLQQIAQGRFAISVGQTMSDNIIYSTYDSTNNDQIKHVLTKDLWLLPNYYLGISTRGTSIESIIKERTNTNLILIIALDAALILGVILVFRNVRKEVQLAQNKSDFISNVSHEIRTPLALISMFAETLELNRVKSEEKKQEYYSIISKETKRLTNIVNKILSFSQMDAGKKVLDFKSVNLATLVTEVLETYEFHLKKEGFTISSKLNTEVNIMADRDAIVELIINLLDNAIKYSEQTKKIEIEVTADRKYASLSVRDHGIGISKKDQRYIFDKFYRASTGDLAKKQGTGLGLALVKQITDFHKGNLELISDKGKGSTFIVHFPLT